MPPSTLRISQRCVMCAKRDSVSTFFVCFVRTLVVYIVCLLFPVFLSRLCIDRSASVWRSSISVRFVWKKISVTWNVCMMSADWSIGWTTNEHRERLVFLRRRMSSFASLLCVKLFIVCCVCIIFHRTCDACSIWPIDTMPFPLDQGLRNIFI